MNDLPTIRVRSVNDGQVNPDGDYVLYWMTTTRRTTWNFALQHAIHWSRDVKKPLIVFEALRCGYPWASDRLHGFVIQGMIDNARQLSRKPVSYYPYLEPVAGAGKGLLVSLARHACVVVTDDFPCFFLPRMVQKAAGQLTVRLECVDSNGLLPMRSADRVFARAYDFRRFLQKNLRPHLDDFPDDDPLLGVRLPKLDRLPPEVVRRWPAADLRRRAVDSERLAQFPIDHSVGIAATRGGSRAAVAALRTFVADRLAAYGASRNEPEREVTSGLSPYLHFGHISAHQVFSEVVAADDWSPENLAEKATGSSQGWWGTSQAVESFLDELITWRELGYNMCWQRDDYAEYESLPDWAKKTLADHADDPREQVYSLREFEAADTHDPLWNAAQRQLVRTGRIHNYLRMLWGKKILEWSESPEDAIDIMIELNNRYALDGRNPNSYSGIFWCLGRYDRAWGPERPIFGKVRYMSSANTARKLNVRGYIEEYSAKEEGDDR
jgi:deoxyribodipyrimidine photo-lyase